MGRLAARRENRAIVRLVEAWSAQGPVTPRARLAQAQAFFELRLMDRAAMRAREIGESPDQPEALLLLARVYVERGWPLRARKPLLALKELGHDVGDLWPRAHQEPVRPEHHARDIEREGNPDRLLGLAESFLAAGSFLRATGILERLRRADPSHQRVEELLWGLAGDFAPNATSLEDLAGEYERLVAEPLDESEHTESASPSRDPLPDDAGRFPALFKQGADAASGGTEEEGEHTHSSGRSTAADPAAPADGTDPGLKIVSVAGGTGAGDTQILLVLRPGEDPRDRQVHRRRDSVDGAPLNLRDWQASMGVTPGPRAPTGDVTEDHLEAEDENVVMMTRPEPPAAPDPEPTESRARPIEVVEKHAQPLPPAPPAPPPPPEVEVVPPAPLGLSRLGLLLGAGMVLLLVIAALAVLAFGQLRPMMMGRRADVEAVLADGELDTLLREERELEGRSVGDRAAALALARVRLAIWSDWDGAPTRFQEVTAFLAEPGSADAQGVQVLAAATALATNDLDAAQAALNGRAPRSAEERLVFDELAVRRGETPAAWPGLPEGAESKHARRLRARVAAHVGHIADARDVCAALLAEDPSDAQAAVLALEVQDGDDARALADAERLLARTLPPRLEARVRAVAASALVALDRPADAEAQVERGLARDGTNPALLRARAAGRVQEHALVDALRDLELAERSPGARLDVDIARALVLLDLDRVEDATRTAEAAARRDPAVGAVLQTVVSAVGSGTVPSDRPPLGADALGAYADAIVAQASSAPDASSRLAEAARRLEADRDPFLHRLAPRVRALQAIADPAGAAELVAMVERDGADDPMAHLALGLYFEQAGERGRAALHIDRAAALGPEYARIWYERARFYEDAEDTQERSQEARFRYLGLAPSGPRAERARTWLASAG